MTENIKITGEPMTAETCRFIISQPVYAGNSAYFSNAESAKGSPLAERLFAIPNVESVLIADNRVTVTKQGFEEWRDIGMKIGAAIREHIASGDNAVSEELAASEAETDRIRNAVADLITREINPAVASHGGFVSLIDVRGNTVYLELGGGCQGCGMAHITLKQGIERAIRDKVPGVGEILDTTDHAAGTNPYFATGM
ncbi:MAG: NifU family protein [Candidatus Zixiibacteriota bacterium]